MTEEEHHLKIEEAVRAAERLFSLAHVDGDDEEAYLDEQERLYHCEVCTVREVLEVFWPPVQDYIDWLKSQIPQVDPAA